jgi:hypothetical protein
VPTPAIVTEPVFEDVSCAQATPEANRITVMTVIMHLFLLRMAILIGRYLRSR